MGEAAEVKLDKNAFLWDTTVKVDIQKGRRNYHYALLVLMP